MFVRNNLEARNKMVARNKIVMDTLSKMAVVSIKDGRPYVQRWSLAQYGHFPTTHISLLQLPYGLRIELRSHGGVVVRLLDLHLGIPVSIPGRVAPGRCRCTVSFLGDLPFPPALHSGAAPNSPRFTPIGFQDLAVKSHPNLSTPLSTRLQILKQQLRHGATRKLSDAVVFFLSLPANAQVAGSELSPRLQRRKAYRSNNVESPDVLGEGEQGNDCVACLNRSRRRLVWCHRREASLVQAAAFPRQQTYSQHHISTARHQGDAAAPFDSESVAKILYPFGLCGTLQFDAERDFLQWSDAEWNHLLKKAYHLESKGSPRLKRTHQLGTERGRHLKKAQQIGAERVHRLKNAQ
ncbi:hypothetical protein PR048_012059 [Dryococelus australis]|uniref:Uncharacterized protein n=1 Tax=Dryococelus australis TaxID=614101 RepID=A0ABQ9HNB2_9NEOP|nr:hypothetical protein PR048_012059 [Dryococelus australis]